MKTKTKLKSLQIIMMVWVLSPLCHAQPQNGDSLWAVWKDASMNDSIRLEALRSAIWERYFFNQPDSAFHYAALLYERAEVANMKQMMAEALNIQAGTYYFKGELETALEYSKQYVDMYEQYWPDSRNRAAAWINIGQLYSAMGDKVKAIQCFEKSLKIAKEHDYVDTQAGSLMNLGNEYESLSDFEIATEYLEEALVLYRELGDPGKLGVILSNLAIARKNQDDYNQALKYVLEAEEIHQELGDPFYLTATYLLIGQIYMELEEFENAEMYLKKGLETGNKFDMKKDAIGITITLGELYWRKDELAQAIEFCGKGLEMAEANGLFEEELAACNCLYHANKTLGNSTRALDYYERYQSLTDSLKITETTKELQRVEFDKQLYADSLKQVQEKHDIELNYQKQVAAKDKTRNGLVGTGILLLIIVGGLVTRNRHVTRSRRIIKKEKERSDELLLNILPTEVAAELKAKGESEAKDFDNVTVLFSDFKQFTQTAEKLTAKELVKEINTCFKAFDAIMNTYGIEKIKTIDLLGKANNEC